MTAIYHLQPAKAPLLVSVPHAGTGVPRNIMRRLAPSARCLPDTDWHVDELWAGAIELGAGMLAARHSRYVIDLNRSPDDQPLYEGAGTGLVPMETFDGQPVYIGGAEPTAAEIDQRRQAYWQPYHDALRAELERIRSKHGYALLLDAHSIRDHVPRLFDGRLPHLNLGSNDGASASAGLISLAVDQLLEWAGFTRVLDGRLRGGYITRHYGRPAEAIHALQFEMAQSVYMSDSLPERDDARLEKARWLVNAFLERLMAWSPGHE